MKKHGIRPVIGLSVMIKSADEGAILAYIYAKDDEGYRNLLKMSSAVSIRDSETLPIQWLAAYGAGCLITLPMTRQLVGQFTRLKRRLREIIKESGKASLVIGVSRPGWY